jgi:hypothetical protein
MTYQTLKLVPGQYRLSFEIGEDGGIEILDEICDGDLFDYSASISLTQEEYRFVADFIAQCAGKASYEYGVMMAGIQELRVEVGPEEIRLATYLCGGIRTESLEVLDLRPADWSDMLPILDAAVGGPVNGGVA